MSSVTIDEVHRLAKQLSPTEQLRLMEQLARELRDGSSPSEFPASVLLELAAAVLPPEDFSDWERK